LDASDARLSHLEAIERGLAELLIHLEHQRLPNLARAGSPPPEVEELTRDLADLRQTEKRTQESLELVHGTLGHVVDRLATIETDMRSSRERGTETARGRAGVPDPVRAAKTEPATTVPAGKKPTPQQAQAKSKSEGEGGSERGAERLPIDPTLPPDQPLEPGSSRRPPPGGSAAERIAASEEALAGAKPALEPDAGGKTNFISAAPRAAPGASRGAAAEKAPKGPEENASAARQPAKPAGPPRGRAACAHGRIGRGPGGARGPQGCEVCTKSLGRGGRRGARRRDNGWDRGPSGGPCWHTAPAGSEGVGCGRSEFLEPCGH